MNHRYAPGKVEQTELKAADYRHSVALGDRYDAREQDLCVVDLVAIQSADWLRSYSRLLRQTWTVPEWEIAQLQQTLAGSYAKAECIALALRLADLCDSGDWFKDACRLAQTSTIAQLETAFYEIQNREKFITVVLALVHFELFNSFEFGDYVVKVELVKKDGKFFRQYTNP